MVSPFEAMVQQLTDLGFFGFFLPVLLLFVVSYGLLLKTKALGDDQKVMVAASLVLSLFILGFGSIIFGRFFSSLFGIGTIVLAGILVIALFIGMAGGDISKIAGDSRLLMMFVAGIGVVVFFLALSSIGIVISGPVAATVFFIVVILVAVALIAK
ncbi:MAG: hypothetical protein HYY37_03110 [Candidatus Aenigmarchaeota archaeon]|nr:hypothetical protein [Candidatus Aenigmarchaeota archaeon]